MSWSLDDVPIFIGVVEHGGITAAATALGMPKSTVSTALARLEHGLGLRLMDRNSRKLRVTEEGETFYRQAQRIMDQVHETTATMAGMTSEPTGRIAVAMPPAFCVEVVAPRLAELRRDHPRLLVDISVTPDGARLLRDRVDLAVTIGTLEDSDLIARPLLSGPLVWVASPAYAAAHEIGPGVEDIRRHVQICERRYGMARLPLHLDGQATQIDLNRGIAHVSNPLVVRSALEAGAGVSLLPRHYCGGAFAEGRLVEVCPHATFDISASVLTAVYPERRLQSPRVRVFLDFLSRICREHMA